MTELVQVEAEQIAKYEQFLKKLRGDQHNAEIKIKSLQQKFDDYQQVQEYMANGVPEKFTKMNAGSNTFLDVELVNPGLLVLEVGMNIFIEMTFEEAKSTISKQVASVEKKVTEAQQSLQNVIAYIEQVEEILLQFK